MHTGLPPLLISRIRGSSYEAHTGRAAHVSMPQKSVKRTERRWLKNYGDVMNMTGLVGSKRLRTNESDFWVAIEEQAFDCKSQQTGAFQHSLQQRFAKANLPFIL